MKNKKILKPREALRQAIKPGDRIFFSIASGQPQTLLQALAEDFEYYQNVEVFSGYLLTEHPLAKKEFTSSFRCFSFQISPPLRQASSEGLIQFIPARISEIPLLLSRKGPFPVDVVLVQVAPPDHQRNFSLGVSTSQAFPLALQARTVVAEVNENAPRTFGPCSLSHSQISYIVESTNPLIPYADIQIGENERKIAEFVAELIPDGATIQMGIGNLPTAILQILEGKKDLGVHSGMLSDAIVDLVTKGVITNKKKNLFQGKIIAGELIGSKKLFQFGHENPLLEMHGAEVSHNAQLIGSIDNFIAINSALEIDLFGQINAESLNGEQVSGVGGQFDFVEGAYYSRGGMSITVLNSSAGKGKISRIVPHLSTQTTVTIPRYMADIVVTEYGVARLRGKSLWQRAEALISIAHPNFHDSLCEALSTQKYGKH